MAHCLIKTLYQLNCWQRLKNFLKRIFYKEISLQVEDAELLVRGVVHPMFYSESDSALKREAFLPPPAKNDVSLLRHRYTEDSFCKNHSASLKIGTNKYCGLATFIPANVVEINALVEISMGAVVKASPIDENGNYVSNVPVFVDSPGLPMHADLLYDKPLIKGEPATEHRKFAQKLAKVANYFNDPAPNAKDWSGKKLAWCAKVAC